MGTNWSHIVRRSPVEVLSASFSDARQRSKMPIVFAFFVVACLSWIPRTRVASAITTDLICVPLSDMIAVGRYVWRVMMLTRALAMVLASILVTHYVN